MKNFSNNNYSGKARKQNKKNTDSNFYSRNTKSSKKNNRYPMNPVVNQGGNNFNEGDKKKVSFSSLKRRNPINKSNEEVYPKSANFSQTHAN